MLGIVACETLYTELERLAPDAAVRYVPQWLHEFPINEPNSERIHRELQDCIDELEREPVDRILVLYHDRDGVAGIQTEQVPLYVSTVGDCIELFLQDEPVHDHGERKATGTYYLTRGRIDCGVDCYKVFSAYEGELSPLRERFDDARRSNPDVRVRWPESDIVTNAAEKGPIDPRPTFRSLVGCYHRIVLLDTGALLPFHQEYAERFREFVANVGWDSEERPPVTLSVRTGDISVLTEMLSTDPDRCEYLIKYSPTVPVETRDITDIVDESAH